jgi:amino acid transporter
VFITWYIHTFSLITLGLTIREFAKHIPTSGSFYTFVSIGLGKGDFFIHGLLTLVEMGFLTVWTMIFGYGILTINCVLQFSAWSSDAILRNTGTYVGWYYLSIGLIVVATLLAWGGINQSLTLCLILGSCESVIVFVFSIILVVNVYFQVLRY